jgi:FAD/FMN-containing dehydrogenase
VTSSPGAPNDAWQAGRDLVAGDQVGSPAPSAEPLPTALRDALAAAGIVVITDPDLLAGHCVDWTGRWSGPTLGAVRPRTTEQVSAVLAAARSAGVVVQVQGGNTGLVGGSVPDRPALLLLTTGLDRIDPVDPLERTVVVGAGVTAAQLAAHARAARLHFGVDLAARDSATIGGMVATNAGGMGVCAFGMMREQVRGLVAVLADGRVVRTVGRPRKDNCGYDLAALIVGSEGTLAVITEVEIALHPQPRESSVALLAVTDLADAVRCARRVEAGAAMLLAAEVVDSAGATRAAQALGNPDPLPDGAQWVLLLEVADGGTATGFEPVADLVVAVATDRADRQRLWALRERQTELYATLPGLQKLDVSVRLTDLDPAVAAIRAVVAGAGADAGRGTAPPDGFVPPAGTGGQDDPPPVGGEDRPWVGFFGHALDGNLHVQVVGADTATADRVLRAVAELGGSISAEHGIGRLKVAQLHLARSAEQIDWMRRIKATVDPDGLLNPGVLFDQELGLGRLNPGELTDPAQH